MTGRAARPAAPAGTVVPGVADPPGGTIDTPEQTPPGRPDRPAQPFGIMGWLRWGWRQLTSMRTALDHRPALLRRIS